MKIKKVKKMNNTLFGHGFDDEIMLRNFIDGLLNEDDHNNMIFTINNMNRTKFDDFFKSVYPLKSDNMLELFFDC